MMLHGWFWCELQDVIKNKIEWCVGVSLVKNSFHVEPLYHCILGAEIVAVSWSGSECCEKLYIYFLLTIEVFCHLSFIVIRRNI